MRPLHIPKIRALDLTERYWRDRARRKAMWKLLSNRLGLDMFAIGSVVIRDMTGEPTVCFGSDAPTARVRRPRAFDLGRQ